MAVTFVIHPGVKCLVRQGEGEWVPHRTTKRLEFDRYTVADNGGRWLFRQGEWQIKVASSQVDGRGPKQKRAADATNSSPGVGTFNKSILGRNGKGASRRRARRR